jgi:hypothetical protein
LEIQIGFREGESAKARAAKTIVFPDNKTCYLRNFGDYEQFTLEHDSTHFLSNVSQFLAHEFLHLWLDENVSEEACSQLNSIDGFFGYLVERTKICAGCGKPITRTPYVIHGGLHWHKKCMKKYHDQNA